MDWKTFFDDYGEYHVRINFFECSDRFTLEELYRMFKQRLLGEQDDKNIKE